jgi:hypothetical protein
MRLPQNSSFSVLKKKGGVEFWEILPFNPTLYGWQFKEACCCNIKFQKGKVLLTVNDKGIVQVKKADGKLLTYNTPKSQLQFKVLEHGIKSDSFLRSVQQESDISNH